MKHAIKQTSKWLGLGLLASLFVIQGPSCAQEKPAEKKPNAKEAKKPEAKTEKIDPAHSSGVDVYKRRSTNPLVGDEWKSTQVNKPIPDKHRLIINEGVWAARAKILNVLKVFNQDEETLFETKYVSSHRNYFGAEPLSMERTLRSIALAIREFRESMERKPTEAESKVLDDAEGHLVEVVKSSKGMSYYSLKSQPGKARTGSHHVESAAAVLSMLCRPVPFQSEKESKARSRKNSSTIKKIISNLEDKQFKTAGFWDSQGNPAVMPGYLDIPDVGHLKHITDVTSVVYHALLDAHRAGFSIAGKTFTRTLNYFKEVQMPLGWKVPKSINIEDKGKKGEGQVEALAWHLYYFPKKFIDPKKKVPAKRWAMRFKKPLKVLNNKNVHYQVSILAAISAMTKRKKEASLAKELTWGGLAAFSGLIEPKLIDDLEKAKDNCQFDPTAGRLIFSLDRDPMRFRDFAILLGRTDFGGYDFYQAAVEKVVSGFDSASPVLRRLEAYSSTTVSDLIYLTNFIHHLCYQPVGNEGKKPITGGGKKDAAKDSKDAKGPDTPKGPEEPKKPAPKKSDEKATKKE